MTEKKEGVKKNKIIESFRHDQSSLRFRFFAALVDYLIIGLICYIANLLFGVADLESYLQMQRAVDGLAASDPLVLERMKMYQVAFIQMLLIGMVYDSLMMVLFKASIGKLVFGFRVFDAKEGRHILLSKLLLVLRAVIKALSIYLTAIPYAFMCLTTFGNAEHRSGFDMFSSTKVVYVRRNKKDEDFSEKRSDG